MRQLLFLAGLTLLVQGQMGFAQTAQRQNVPANQLQVTQDKDFKIKVKDERLILRDKSKPVRRALEEMYAKIAEAQRNEDIDALRATRTPDFSVDMPNGQRWDWKPL